MVDTPAIEEPSAPDISHQNPADRRQWFGHPRQLARLFTTEAMERFGYYGMRALLTLYLAKHFLFSDATTTGLYGGFTALVYLTPLVGGLIADRYLGSKRSVKFGALMMSLVAQAEVLRDLRPLVVRRDLDEARGIGVSL